jgi:hypothetical protein
MNVYQKVMVALAIAKVDKTLAIHLELLNENSSEPIDGLAYMNKLGDDFRKEFESQIPSDNIAENIKTFKNDVGDEIWQDVKNNPGLTDIVAKHIQSKSQKVFDELCQRIFDLLKEADQVSVSKGDEPLTIDDIKVCFANR